MIDGSDELAGPRWPLSPELALEHLFRGRSAAEWRLEYADAFDWGPEVGRETVDA